MNVPQAAIDAAADAMRSIGRKDPLGSPVEDIARAALEAAAAPIATDAAAAERERLLHAPLDRFGFTIARYTEPGHSPEDRWDRGYQCAMRKIADLLQGNS